MQTVHDIMTTAVWAVHRDTVVREVEGIFVTHKISGAPLIDDLGNLVGWNNLGSARMGYLNTNEKLESFHARWRMKYEFRHQYEIGRCGSIGSKSACR